MKMIIAPLLLITLFFFNEKYKLTGRWQSPPSPTGAVTGIVFKSDSTFEGFINRKPFVSGKYVQNDSIFSFVDNGCEGKRGIYKLIFFSNEDSLRFQPIQDSCTGRMEGMKKLVVGRVK